MAVNLQIAKSFRISRSLFRNDDGSPIVFYSEYSSDDLQSIIHKGGGILKYDPSGANFLLCEKRTDNRIRNGYLPVDFIVDCVKRNSFLSVDTYRTEHLGLKASTSTDEVSTSSTNVSDEEEHMVKISGSSRITVKTSGLLGRKKYSDLEDLKIIKYLINHDKTMETGGNVVWKQMELVKVTDHSYQSMKARFQKTIVPEIDTYNIPADWKAKLCRNVYCGIPEKDNGLNEPVQSFDNIDTWKSKEKSLKLHSCSSESSAAASSLHDQHSKTLNSYIMTTEGSKGVISDDSTKDTLDQVDSVILPDIHQINCEPTSTQIVIPEDSSIGQVSISKEVAETQNSDYNYDEMDCLITSEANKNKDLDDHGRNSKKSKINNARKRSKEIINCDECSPIKLKNLRSTSFANEEKNEMKSGSVENNKSGKFTKSSESRIESVPEKKDSINRQQIVSDGKVNKEYAKSNKTIYLSRNKLFSETEMVVSSKDGSSDTEMSCEERVKHAKRKTPKAIPALKNYAVNKTNTRLRSDNQEEASKKEIVWRSKKLTMRKVKKGGGSLKYDPSGASFLTEHLGLRASTSTDEVSTSSANVSDEEEHMVKISASSRITVKPSGLLGRKKYSDLEDLKIIKYLINHDKTRETGGNVVWKQMELVKVTDHSYQSMKARFQKKIVPEIDTYNIPADWKAKLCRNVCHDIPEKDNGLNEPVQSFDNIDTWKSKEKSLKPPSCSSDSSAATSSLHEHSKVFSRSIETTESSKSVISEDSTQDTLDQVEYVMLPDVQINCEPSSTQIIIPEDSSIGQVSISKEVAETQNSDYNYDEMDCLIISEANKNKDLDDHDRNSKKSNINNARKRSKKIINCNECSPIKLKNLRSTSFANKEKNEVRRDNSVIRQQIVSDGQVNKEYAKSISKIVNIIGKGSSNSKTKKISLTPRKSNLKPTNNEMDTHHIYKLTMTKESFKNNKVRNISPDVHSVYGGPVVVHQDSIDTLDKSHPELSCQNLPEILSTESMINQQDISNISQSKSAGKVREKISDLQTNTTVYLSRNKLFSKTETIVSSKDGSSDTDMICEERVKHAERKTPKAIPASKNDAVSSTNTKLTSDNQEAVSKKEVLWCSKESTMRKVKYLNEEYGLDIVEATNLLEIVDGNFLAAIQYLGS